MRTRKEIFEELEPNYPNRKKSVHGRGGGQAGHVRIRHPEHHKSYDGGPDGSPELPMDAVQPCECPPADAIPDCVLDDFKRVVSPPTYSPGDPGLTYIAQYQLKQYALHYAPFDVQPLTFIASNSVHWIDSYKGSYYLPWTTRPAGSCVSLDNYFNGWMEREAWTKFLVTAKPDNVAGIVFSAVDAPSAEGVGPANGFAVRVASAQPSSLRAGTLVGTIPNNGVADIFVPAHLIPAEGEYLWMGMTPNWMCDHDTGWWICGWTWPWRSGEGNSGGLAASAWEFALTTRTWQVWDAAEMDYGSPNSGDGDCDWGDLPPWQIVTDGTAPTVDGSKLCFTVAAGAPKSMSMTLPGASAVSPDDADDLDYREPWTNEDGTNIKVLFHLTTAGSLTEAGTRSFSMSWHDTRDLIRGTVYLGDTSHAQGLSLFVDDVESAFVAKDIAEGAWHWLRIDTRHPDYARMKFWPTTSGEPVAWDIDVLRTDSADRPTTDNFFQLAMTLGNMTGADQTLCIDKIVIGGTGSAFRWVVEYLGDGDGLTSVFHTSQSYQSGTLSFFVDGLHVMPFEIDATLGSFSALQQWPAAAGARIVARYMVSTVAAE